LQHRIANARFFDVCPQRHAIIYHSSTYVPNVQLSNNSHVKILMQMNEF